MKFDKVKYDNQYQKDNYDRIALNVPKGDKEKIRIRATEKGYAGITEYIKALIYQDMSGGGTAKETGTGEEQESD